MRTLLLCALASMVLAGCASLNARLNPKWVLIHPDWAPPQGFDYARAQCKASASRVVDTSIGGFSQGAAEGKAFRSCMQANGYAYEWQAQKAGLSYTPVQ